MRNSHASSPLYLRDARCINVLYALSVEDVDRHITAAEVHGLTVVLHAEVDAVADDGAARVRGDGLTVAGDVEPRPERDHIRIDGCDAVLGRAARGRDALSTAVPRQVSCRLLRGDCAGRCHAI